MVHVTKEIMSMERNLVKVLMCGLMEAHMMETGQTIESKVTVLIHGLMVGNMWGNGVTTTCTATVFTSGKMADAMKDITNMTKSMGTESMSGQTVASMKETGLLVNNTDKVGTFQQMGKFGWGFGTMANELNGSMI